jgi:hypothetical protein
LIAELDLDNLIDLVAFDDLTKSFMESIMSVWFVGDVQNCHGPVILSHPERMYGSFGSFCHYREYVP